MLVIDAKYKKLQTDESRQVEIITSDARQVWSYCLVPRQKLEFGMLVYPKHMLVEQTKERYKMKNGVTLILRTLDLSKERKEEFETECEKFASEIITLINNEIFFRTTNRPQRFLKMET